MTAAASCSAVARALDPAARVPWYGPPMGARSFVTARLMETWAHGQDVVDALGVERRPTDRLRHVAHIGVRARPFSYVVHGLDVPEVDVAVELTGPDGDVDVGRQPARRRVSGPALDFCLVVTQRRHRRRHRPGRASATAAAEWIAHRPGLRRTARRRPAAGRCSV